MFGSSNGEKEPDSHRRRRWRGRVILAAVLAVAVVVPVEPTAAESPTGMTSDGATEAVKKCKKNKKRRKCRKRSRSPRPERAPAGTQTGPQAGQYAGSTAQGLPVSFTVANGTVDGFATQVELTCTGSSGGQFTEQRPFAPPPGPAPVDRAGNFSRETSDGSGTTFKYSGRFGSPSAVSGVLNMGVTEYVYGGVQVCATPGDISWSATRR